MNPHALLPHAPTLTASADWQTYYQANAAAQLPIPWERGAELTGAERAAIAASLAAWQLGETSDGQHLMVAVRRYAQRMGDPTYLDVVQLFIEEEQRHGGRLGQFLDLAQIPRLQKNWDDSLFRCIRYSVSTISHQGNRVAAMKD